MKILCIGKIVTFRGDFFEKNLLLQSDVVFDSESNGSNFSSLAQPGDEKKIIFHFFAQNDVMTPPISHLFGFLRPPVNRNF